jgi:hypothetical protein
VCGLVKRGVEDKSGGGEVLDGFGEEQISVRRKPDPRISITPFAGAMMASGMRRTIDPITVVLKDDAQSCTLQQWCHLLRRDRDSEQRLLA